jgi:hypothetical protein
MAELIHEQLWQICQRKPSDFEPYGERKRLTATRPAQIAGDCSGGCKLFHTPSGGPPLIGASAAIPEVIVPDSTPFEPQGCPEFEQE